MAVLDLKIKARAIMFGDMAKGGYFRSYKATDYPGIELSVSAKTRNDKAEWLVFYNGQEYETTSAAVAAWKRDNPGKDPGNAEETAAIS